MKKCVSIIVYLAVLFTSVLPSFEMPVFAADGLSVTYEVRIPDFDKGEATIKAVIEGALPSTLKVSEIDYSSVNKNMKNLSFLGAQGVLKFSEGAPVPHIKGTYHRQWFVETGNQTSITMSYEVQMNTVFERTGDFRGYIGEGFAQFEAGQLLLYPEGTSQSDGLKVKFTVPSGSEVYTPWIKEGDAYYPNRTKNAASTRPSAPHSRLNDSVLIGQFKLVSQGIGQTELRTVLPKSWSAKQIEGVSKSVQSMMDYYTSLFGASVGKTYMVGIAPQVTAASGRDIFAGENEAAQGTSFVSASRFYTKAGHQMFHRWNGWEYGFSSKVHGALHREGNNRYYESKAIIAKVDEMDGLKFNDLQVLENYYARYLEARKTELGSRAYSSYSSTSANSNESAAAYDFGALIWLMLDMDIMETTQRQKSADDVMKIIFSRYGNYQGELSHSAFIDILREVTGKDYSSFVNDYINGTKELPLARVFKDDDGDQIPYYIEMIRGTDPNKTTKWQEAFKGLKQTYALKQPSITFGGRESSNVVSSLWGISQGASVHFFDKHQNAKTIVWVKNDAPESQTPPELVKLFEGMGSTEYNYIQVKHTADKSLILVNAMSLSDLKALVELVPAIPAENALIPLKPVEEAEPVAPPVVTETPAKQTQTVHKLTKIIVKSPASIKLGQSAELKVYGLYADGSQKLLTQGLKFTTTGKLVSVSSKGLVKGLKKGTAVLNITDSLSGLKTSVKIVVK